MSPLTEAALSFNALLFPRSRPVQHPWIRSARDLPTALRREIRAFGFAFDFAIPDCLLPARQRKLVVSWDDGLGAIARLGATEAAYEITRPAFHYALDDPGATETLARDDVRRQILQRARRHGPRGVEVAELAFTDPAALRERFLRLFQWYWESGFQRTWQTFEPQLAASARHDARSIAKDGVYSILDARFADTVIDGTAGWIQRFSPHNHEVRPTRGNPLTLIPSFFVWPHIRVNCDAPWPLALVYPPRAVLDEGQIAGPPAELVAAARVLGDETNLQILRALAERPRPAEELAPLLALTPAATTRRLTQLARAGFVRGHRQGYYVVYRGLPERVPHVELALREYLGH